MSVITPPTGAIPLYLWIKYQRGIKTLLESVSTAQALLNSAYAFAVYTNMYRPSIEDIYNQAMVNILIDNVQSENAGAFSKNHVVTFHIDCYVRGKNEDDPDNTGTLIPADEVAVERLQYLCCQVEYGLTQLKNFYAGLESGQVMPGGLSLQFSAVDDGAESATPYAPARFILTAKFPYTPADLTGLPPIEQLLVTFPEWAANFIYYVPPVIP
jgi:hypothetical protein